MTDITIEAKGIDETKLYLDGVRERLPRNLGLAIAKLTAGLQYDIKYGKLSGQALNVRTGTLRNSINTEFVHDGTEITGRVFTDTTAYGPLHEYGFKGIESVSAHLRTITQAFGRSITPKTIEVRAHSRSVDFPVRSFMRTALAELEKSGIVQRELNDAVERSL